MTQFANREKNTRVCEQSGDTGTQRCTPDGDQWQECICDLGDTSGDSDTVTDTDTDSDTDTGTGSGSDTGTGNDTGTGGGSDTNHRGRSIM